MSNWYLYIAIFIFLMGATLAMCLTPIFQILADRLDFMDRPKGGTHKGHVKATPLLGGAAMFTAWIVVIGVGFIIFRLNLLPKFAENINWQCSAISCESELIWLIFGAFLAMMLGLIDDKWAMKASWKFLGQFIVAAIAVFLGGARISLFMPYPWISVAGSIFWFMLLMNAINFFDNMDGLAVGTIAIALGLFGVVAMANEQYLVCAFAAVSCGVCVGFWFFNHNPASIFMGDSGSHFLGFLAAVTSTLTIYFKLDASLSRFPVLIPIFILAVPLFDTLAVVVIRTLNRKPFWIGDHNHISHRFVKMGLSRGAAVKVVHLMALAIGLGVFPIMWGTFSTAAVIVFQAILLLIIVSFMQISLGRESK